MSESHAPPLSIITASVLSKTKLILELSDGRSILLTLEQILTLTPEVTMTDIPEKD